ncbi:MAG TPA: NUDIX hydrolase [Candidatus Omnitrophota bacterium]|nr:NUDIX hydrolase [Candidatus Omnitrophota bacterium]
MPNDRKIFHGRLLKLYSRSIRLPNGFVAGFEIIKHPGAALVIPFMDRDTVIMLRQLRPVIGRYLYELPAGTRSVGESARRCALREIIEETGFLAGSLTRVGTIYPVPGYSTEKIDIFSARSLRRAAVRPEQDEILECIPMGRATVRRMFKSGMIVDAKTICALSFIGWLN